MLLPNLRSGASFLPPPICSKPAPPATFPYSSCYNIMQSLQSAGPRRMMWALAESDADDDRRYPAPSKEMTAQRQRETLLHISGSIDMFSHLWHVRQTLLKPEGAGAPVPMDLGARITSSLDNFADSLFAFQTSNRKGPRDDLEQVLLSTGLTDLLYDIIMTEGFLQEALWFTSGIFHSLMTVVLNVQKFDCFKVGAQLAHRTPQLRKHLWDHPIAQSIQLLAILGNDRLQDFCGPKSNQPGRPAPHVAQISMFIWISLAGFMHLTDPDAQVVQGLVICVTDGLADDVRDKIVETLILDEYGADPFFERFKRQIEVARQVTFTPSPADSDRIAFFELSALRSFACSPLLRAHFDEHRAYELFIRTLAPMLNTCANVQDCVSVWLACNDLTALSYNISMQRGMRALCSLGDPFYLMSRGVDLLAQHGSGLHAYNGTTSDTTKQFELTLMLTIRLYCHNASKWSRGNLSEHTPQDVEEMKVAARLDWWPSLRALRTAKYRSMRTPQRKYYDRVLSVWTELGHVLGLDTEKERKRHENEAAHRCTWFACLNHRSTSGMGTLKACKGCGEVRYCGRECQKRDWNKGGHKEKCRRLT